MKMSEKSDKKKKKSNPILFIAFGIFICCMMLGGIVVYRVNALNKHLSEGNKNLEEEQFNDAIASFDGALKLFPNSADAYLGLTKAYIGLGELETAMSVLQEGIDKTGSENLEDSKELVYDQVFATYVLNYYSLNLLKGETKQLEVAAKGKDMNFSVEFSSEDTSIATVSDSGLISAVSDGLVGIVATVGNDTWGYRDKECLLTVGVVVTYLEEQGCQYVSANKLTAPAFVYQENDNSERIYDGTLKIKQNDAEYIFKSATASDPDADGRITYTVEVEVTADTEFGIEAGTYEATHEWYYNWKTADLLIADEYTGMVFAPQDLFGYDEPVIDSKLEYNNREYNIFGQVKSEWINEENWETTGDTETKTTWAKAPVIGNFTYTLVAPQEYQGFVFALDSKGITDYSEKDMYDVEGDYFFLDKMPDGKVRNPKDYYVIRLSDIIEK